MATEEFEVPGAGVAAAVAEPAPVSVGVLAAVLAVFLVPRFFGFGGG